MYNYEKYYFRLFSPLMVLTMVIFLIYGEYIGASIAFLLGILLSFSYQGIKVDLENNRYIRYDRFLWIVIGSWKPLSPPSYVTVVRINLSSRRTIPSPLVLPEDKQNAKSYKVNLVVDGAERYVNVCRGSLDKMISEALQLGRYLNVRVLDFTTPDKKWIL